MDRHREINLNRRRRNNEYPLRWQATALDFVVRPSDLILPPFSGIFFTISRSERRRRRHSHSLPLSARPIAVRASERAPLPLGQFLSFKVSTVDMKIVLSQSVSPWMGRSLGPGYGRGLMCRVLQNFIPCFIFKDIGFSNSLQFITITYISTTPFVLI